jgi:photosystem II stability/assembly factor-like uncharacterized protein
MKNAYSFSKSPRKNEGSIVLSNFLAQRIKTFLLVLCLAGIGMPAFSQWSVINSGTTETLRSPWFIDENTGVIVGEALLTGEAIILKTTNGGNTWETKASGTANALRGVQLLDDDLGYAVGFEGTILKTTNAGETWTTVSSGTTQALRSIHFPSHDTGYIAGGAGTMLKTTNAGATWTAQTTNVTQDLINVRFATNEIGFAVATTSTFTDGMVIRTENGGATWTSVYTNPMGLLGLAVPNASTIYAGGGNNQGTGGNSYIVRSTDGGDTWDEVYSGVPNGALRGAWFVTPAKGWFVGDLGELPGTNDGGNTWVNDSIQLNGLLGIHFPNEMVGYAVGAAGTILKYGVESACPQPTGLTVGKVNPTAAQLKWNAEADAIHYKVFYHPATMPELGKKPSSTNSVVLKNLMPNTKYKWAVQSICGVQPLVESPLVMGPDFTTPPMRFGEDASSSLQLEIYPNPASDNATISFSLDNESQVVLALLDVDGRMIKEIANAKYEEGIYQFSFNNKDIPSGVYLVQLTTNDELITKKLVIER